MRHIITFLNDETEKVIAFHSSGSRKILFQTCRIFFFNFHVKNTQSEIKMTIYLSARITVFVENFLSHHDYVPQIEPFNRLRD